MIRDVAVAKTPLEGSGIGRALDELSTELGVDL
jgi:hypothetical protein